MWIKVSKIFFVEDSFFETCMSECKTTYTLDIATDRRGYPHNIFLISPQKICCGYSLEAPRRGASNEYLQHMFSCRNKKDIRIFRMKKAPYLLLCLYFSNMIFSNSSHHMNFHIISEMPDSPFFLYKVVNRGGVGCLNSK